MGKPCGVSGEGREASDLPQPFNVLTAYNRLIHEENGRLRSHCAYCSLGIEGPAGL